MKVALRILADRRHQIHALAPHDRARVREAGNRRLPPHVLAGLDVPGVRQLLAVARRRRRRGRGTTASCRARSSRPAAPAAAPRPCARSAARARTPPRRPAARRCGRESCARFWQVSLTSCSVRCAPSVVKVYLPGSAQAGFGAFVSTSSRLVPAVFHVPIIVGQPCPAIENVPSARNCPANPPKVSGPLGIGWHCCAASAPASKKNRNDKSGSIKPEPTTSTIRRSH